LRWMTCRRNGKSTLNATPNTSVASPFPLC
jgi:hypothetical protein